MAVNPLKSEQLRVRCAPERFNFETTGDLEALDDFVGLPRARATLDFGLDMPCDGYHLFAMGESGSGRHPSIQRFLEKKAAGETIPNDICYVNNFEEQHQPGVLSLPAGSGKDLAHRIENLIEDMRNALRAAFESEDFQNRRQSLDQELQEKQRKAFEQLQEMAHRKNLEPLRTPAGLVIAPVRDGEVISPDELKELPEDERAALEESAGELQIEAQKMFQSLEVSQKKERRYKVDQLQ